MEWSRSISRHPLVNIPRGTRQYWEGQFDAFQRCARILRKASNKELSAEQLKRLAFAIELQANQVYENKLRGVDDET